VSRKWFELVKQENPKSLTDIQRAARLFYLQKNSFAGLIRYPAYHYHVVRAPSFNVGSLPKLLENVHARLQRVQIECLPYDDILRRYDRPETLFYLDPPYWGRKLYRLNFTESDFVKLEKNLRLVKGKFILSLNDLPEARKLFHRYVIREIELAYTAQMKAGKRFRELLITNFTPTEKVPPERTPSA
jgi:DNA adenine methylase